MTDYIPKKWDRAKFYDNNGEPTVIGIVVEVEVLEGQQSFMVLEEQRGDDVDKVWEEGNPFGLKQYWDWEACEFLGKTSYEELLLSENEVIRDFAQHHAEELQNALNPDDGDILAYQEQQKLKGRIADADDDELDNIIDSL